MSSNELYVDLEREQLPGTGIYVRAVRVDGNERRYEDADIVHLDYASLMRWLRSRGGDNIWAEQCVALILGHRIADVKQNVDKKIYIWLCSACGQQNVKEDDCCTQCWKEYEGEELEEHLA